jgi:hypothetical protein
MNVDQIREYRESFERGRLTILELVGLAPLGDLHKISVWQCVFEKHTDVCKAIELGHIKCMAKKCKEDNLKEPHPALLRQTCSFAITTLTCGFLSSDAYPSWRKEVVDIWATEMSVDFPVFLSEMKKEMEEMISDKKHDSTMCSYLCEKYLDIICLIDEKQKETNAKVLH